MLSYVSQYIV